MIVRNCDGTVWEKFGLGRCPRSYHLVSDDQDLNIRYLYVLWAMLELGELSIFQQLFPHFFIHWKSFSDPGRRQCTLLGPFSLREVFRPRCNSSGGCQDKNDPMLGPGEGPFMIYYMCCDRKRRNFAGHLLQWDNPLLCTVVVTGLAESWWHQVDWEETGL